MHPNEELIKTFYSCFQQRNSKGMADCYHKNIEFSDPVFTELKGEQVANMWGMLCSNAKEFKLTLVDYQATDNEGVASWEAEYLFSATGKKVHNKIKATFEFSEGKIIKHQDVFNFWKWSFMALGLTGLLLGGTKFLRNKVKSQANNKLVDYINRQ